MIFHRFYSHYIFIYPDLLLKNCIVEMDDRKHIKKIFPFVKEIERTAFYSGLLAFVPSGVKIENDALLEMIKKRDVADSSNVEFYSENEYQLIHFEDFSL